MTDEMISAMKPGAVIVDCAIDQGGCIEHIRETTHSDPVYEVHEVLHYAVGNIPGAVPNTSTYALTNATLPYAIELATKGARAAASADASLAAGVNTIAGCVPNATVAEALGRAATPLDACWSRARATERGPHRARGRRRPARWRPANRLRVALRGFGRRAQRVE